MIQTMRINIAIVLGLGIAASAALIARAADEPLDAETKARVERFEKGPATVDVSKYPDGIKENYEVFSTKCSQCHKLSRPINSDRKPRRGSSDSRKARRRWMCPSILTESKRTTRCSRPSARSATS